MPNLTAINKILAQLQKVKQVNTLVENLMRKPLRDWYYVGKKISKMPDGPKKTIAKIGWTLADSIKQYGSGILLGKKSPVGKFLASSKLDGRRAATYKVLFGTGKAAKTAKGIGDTAYKGGLYALPTSLAVRKAKSFAPDVLDSEDKYPVLKDVTDTIQDVADTMAFSITKDTPAPAAPHKQQNIFETNMDTIMRYASLGNPINDLIIKGINKI